MWKCVVCLSIFLTSCMRPPTPAYYCPYTCELYEMSWRGNTTMTDPNDPTRLRWCACTHGDEYRIVPPRNPADAED